MTLRHALLIILTIVSITIGGCISEKTVTSGPVAVRYEGVSDEIASKLAESFAGFVNANMENVNTKNKITLILKKQNGEYEITIPMGFNASSEIQSHTKLLLDELAMSLSSYVFGGEPIIVKYTSIDSKTILYTTRGFCDDPTKFKCRLLEFAKYKHMGNATVYYTSQILDEEAQRLGKFLDEINGSSIFVDKLDQRRYEVFLPTIFRSASELSYMDMFSFRVIATKLSEEVFNGKTVILRILSESGDVIHTEISE